MEEAGRGARGFSLPPPPHRPERFCFCPKLPTLPRGQSLAVKDPPSSVITSHALGERGPAIFHPGPNTVGILPAEHRPPTPNSGSSLKWWGGHPLHGHHLGSQSRHRGPFQASSGQSTHKPAPPNATAPQSQALERSSSSLHSRNNRAGQPQYTQGNG